eukprot:CAMPEP_0198112026 /NCGR_PEP_ID=MMETSP1442-20131203/3932_1 /TAXON_ID= /ORGANISM="Craspedostauros australis, Strain CCMP3328" /LENGTH=430 /DNA_ID=CAMNT_0043768669 /DNA_START=122 /DNA_END=1414 /DNA_ORIENTATION=+
MKITASNTALLLLLAGAAEAKSPSRRLAQRYLQDNEDFAEAFDLSADWSCAMQGASSELECEGNNSDCVWCPLGGVMGFCVSSEQGKAVNSLEFPHLQCGEDELLEDDKFWDDLMGCEMASITEEGCLSQPFGCTWCTVEDPELGLCMSSAFMETIESLEDPDCPEKIEDVLKCSTENRETGVEGLFDFSCAMYSPFGESTCVQAIDESGRPCVYQNDEDFGEVCLTPTQSNLLQWIMDMLNDFGIDLDELMGEMPQMEDGSGGAADVGVDMMYEDMDTMDSVPASETYNEPVEAYSYNNAQESYNNNQAYTTTAEARASVQQQGYDNYNDNNGDINGDYYYNDNEEPAQEASTKYDPNDYEDSDEGYDDEDTDVDDGEYDDEEEEREESYSEEDAQDSIQMVEEASDKAGDETPMITIQTLRISDNGGN